MRPLQWCQKVGLTNGGGELIQQFDDVFKVRGSLVVLVAREICRLFLRGKRTREGRVGQSISSGQMDSIVAVLTFCRPGHLRAAYYRRSQGNHGPKHAKSRMREGGHDAEQADVQWFQWYPKRHAKLFWA